MGSKSAKSAIGGRRRRRRLQRPTKLEVVLILWIVW
jgi:hypothetical protein